jgi:hypothetical protein
VDAVFMKASDYEVKNVFIKQKLLQSINGLASDCRVMLIWPFVAAMPRALALGILVGSDAKLEALPDRCQVQYMTTKLIHRVWPRC